MPQVSGACAHIIHKYSSARSIICLHKQHAVCVQACTARNCYPSPLNYYNFPKSSCTSVNEVICHGIPDRRSLQEGDILNGSCITVLSDAPKQAQLWSSSQTRNCFSFWNVKVKSLEVSCCYFINESWRGIWFPSGEYWWQRSETVSAGVWPILAGFYECVYCDVHRSPRSLW